MRLFLTVLVLIINFQSWTKADNASDFEIEGFNIGKSLLDYYPKEKIIEEINSTYSYTYPDKKFTILGIGYGNSYPLSLPQELKNYDELGIVIKSSDEYYKIYQITGEIYCKKNINICFKQEKKIVSDLKEIIVKNVEFERAEFKHQGDSSGESMVYANSFYFNPTGDSISVKVYEWGNKEKQNGSVDILKVSVTFNEYLEYLRNEAWK